MIQTERFKTLFLQKEILKLEGRTNTSFRSRMISGCLLEMFVLFSFNFFLFYANDLDATRRYFSSVIPQLFPSINKMVALEQESA